MNPNFNYSETIEGNFLGHLTLNEPSGSIHQEISPGGLFSREICSQDAIFIGAYFLKSISLKFYLNFKLKKSLNFFC